MKMLIHHLWILAAALVLTLTVVALAADSPGGAQAPAVVPPVPAGDEVITLGAGCFWCTEAVFQQIPGVVSVTSGYLGGTVKHPTYRQVCTGTTGHAEVSRIVFDPQKTSLDRILEVFWDAHDPTSLNRQGPDAGTQYRSAICYETEAPAGRGGKVEGGGRPEVRVADRDGDC